MLVFGYFPTQFTEGTTIYDLVANFGSSSDIYVQLCNLKSIKIEVIRTREKEWIQAIPIWAFWLREEQFWIVMMKKLFSVWK